MGCFRGSMNYPFWFVIDTYISNTYILEHRFAKMDQLIPLVPHIYVSELSSIGSGDGLSPARHQANTWTNA